MQVTFKTTSKTLAKILLYSYKISKLLSPGNFKIALKVFLAETSGTFIGVLCKVLQENV